MKHVKTPISIEAKKAKPTARPAKRNVSKDEQAIINRSLSVIRGEEEGGLFLTSDGKCLEVSKYDVCSVEAAINAGQDGRGSITPFEEFIERILLSYSKGELDLKTLDWHVEELKDSLEALTGDIEIQARLYPAMLREALAKAEGPNKESAVA